MPMLPSQLRHRSFAKLALLIAPVALIAGGLLVPLASASALHGLHCDIELPSYNTVLCGLSKQKGGEYCAKVVHETPSPPSASYAPGSTWVYRMRFQVEGLTGCNPAGVRTVTYFQELRNGPAGAFVRSGKITVRATNVRFLLRDTQAIPLNCSVDAPGSAVRTVVRLSWHPNKGWGGGGRPPDELASKPESICMAQAGSIGHTASTAAVYLNVPMAHPERPASVPSYELNQPDAHDPAKFLSVQSHLSGVTWSSWGGSTASGSGRVEVSSSDTRPGHAQPYAALSAMVSIIASDLVSCGGRQLYTAYTLTLTGADPEPRDFGSVKDRSLPCRMQALRYYAGIEKVANTTGDCLFRGVTEQFPAGFGYLSYCRMQWKGWGKSSTVGTGIARAVTLPSGCDGHHGECDYDVRVRLEKPEWCPAYGMSYTREKLELFGAGVLIASEPQTRTGVVAPSVERHLRATIGRGRLRVFYDDARGPQDCEPS
jgi:hypothetical protein